jgi:hypothetical protein
MTDQRYLAMYQIAWAGLRHMSRAHKSKDTC